MRLDVLGIVLIFSLCVAVNARADKPQQSNRHDSQLDGVWVLKSIETGGSIVDGDGMPERMLGTTRTIDGTQMILSRGGGTRQMTLTIAVDTSGKPKQMDISAERNGKTRVVKCIYEIKKGTLRLAENATERPESFKTDRSTRTMVTTYTRKNERPGTQSEDSEP
ncbi:TIGR03067 domain-containing protein [Roseimaritima ulvae]|uniref:TIGR03067 domain-containing protein n=1 Tax=Roseimaritima ulvae TaxID=980254 RepID=A0A5B9R012_9BACT|nr:TIGR03067 domain-containing protein [Roseimaritima ulvae]QEG42746.1 hypothetical protein UC8_47880 [Roseimaritima ulvae]